MLPKIIVIVLLLVIFSLPISGETNLNHNGTLLGHSGFIYGYYFVKSDDYSVNLGVYLEFCNDMIQFVKNSLDSFEASYDLTMTIMTDDGRVAASSTVSDQIIVPTYQATKDRRLTNFVRKQFKLDFDDYRLVIELTDTETNKKLRREASMQFNHIAEAKLSTSDFIYLNTLNSGLHSVNFDSIRPNLLKTVCDRDTNFGVIIEIYPASLTDSLTIHYQVNDLEDNRFLDLEESFVPESHRLFKKIPLLDSIEYAGKYRLRMTISQKGENLTEESQFNVTWQYVDLNQLSYHKRLLEPLKSYVPEKELKLLESKSDQELEQWFYQYWMDRDPTPETERNELMYEFYRRINFVNSHFGINEVEKASWDTDRGRIYLKYGPPKNIDRHDNDLNRPPFEIWYYAAIDRKFIFEDRSGKGNYELIKIE